MHRLPDAIDPWKAAAEGAEIAASVPGERFSRLAEAVGAVRAPLEVALRFVRRADGARPDFEGVGIEGRIGFALELECQRCLEPFVHRGEARLDVTVTADEEAEREESGETVACAPGDRIALLTLVEDEVLLSLPFAPRCARPECERRRSLDAHAAGAARSRPFAALADALRGPDGGRGEPDPAARAGARAAKQNSS